MAQPTPAPRSPWCPTKCPATPPITAPFTHPASDGPDDTPITASIAAAAISIDFINLLLSDRHGSGERKGRSPAAAQWRSARLLDNSETATNVSTADHPSGASR